MNAVRCFIAVDITDAVKQELEVLLTALRRADADVKWVATGNLHLTLKFLGDATMEQVAQIQSFLKELCSKEKSFSVHFSGLGAFPVMEHPRVLWVGMDEGGDRLKALAEKIEAGVEKMGFAKESRAFSAHLTLGRVRGPRRIKELAQAMKAAAFSSAHKVLVDHVTFYKSTLTPGGAVYEPIGAFYFGKERDL